MSEPHSRNAGRHAAVRAAGGAEGLSTAMVAGLIAVAVVVTYFPSLKGGFLWDDDGHLTSVQLQSWSGLLRIWFEPGVTQQYYPLLHSLFWIQNALWGEWAMGYRLVNLALHTTAGVLFVVLLRRLGLRGAVFAGFLFALHPVCVESVAWISEQKNTLSLVCYLVAALAWLRFEDDRRPGAYAIATLWFAAALFSKTVTSTLPAALLVLAWWRRGRLCWRGDALPLAPWLVLGVGAGLFTAWFEHTGIGAQGTSFDLSLIERGLLAGRVFWFYLGKLIWPVDLVFFYPRWEIDGGEVWQYGFPLAAIALLGVAAWWARQGRGRGPLAALLLYGGTLFPALGVVNVYPFIFSYVADHFQYHASLSFFAFAAALSAALARQWKGRLPARAPEVVAGCLVALLGGLTFSQSRQYTDSITLYEATLADNPDSWVAHHNLASELAQRGDRYAALDHARRAVELKPDFPEALNNLADNLTQVGRAAEALPLLERALELQPRYADAENTLGIALIKLGRVEEGIEHFRRAISLQPGAVEARYNLGLAELERGKPEAAIEQFSETLRLRPDHVGAELNWGVALALSGRMSEGRPHFERALALDPRSAALRQTYGRVLLAGGDPDAALTWFESALRLDPDLPGLHRDLAYVYELLGRRTEARRHAAEAARRP